VQAIPPQRATHFCIVWSVCHIRAPFLNHFTDLDAILRVHLWGPITHCVRWVPWRFRGRGDLGSRPKHAIANCCCHLANGSEEQFRLLPNCVYCWYQCKWLPRKTCLWNDLQCVEWYVELYQTTTSLAVSAVCECVEMGVVHCCHLCVAFRFWPVGRIGSCVGWSNWEGESEFVSAAATATAGCDAVSTIESFPQFSSALEAHAARLYSEWISPQHGKHATSRLVQYSYVANWDAAHIS